MIKLKKLSWSNAFSYGENNSIDFSAAELTQLLGKNGHGKSSIALILEEILYNKNSKGTKKSAVLNRNNGAISYFISLELEKDGVAYTINTVRGKTTQSVKLHKEGVDISAHTSTATYKLIEDLIGFDHKTFTQIVYQSSATSLEFLIATDTARKKFLIDLLNLSKYTKASEIFKGVAKEVSNEQELVILKINTITSWLSKLNSEDLEEKELMEVPEPPTDLATQLSLIEEKLRNIDFTNKKIVQNNKYKEILNTIPLDIVAAPTEDVNSVKLEYAGITKERIKLEKTISAQGPILNNCSSCGQPINNEHKLLIVNNAKIKLQSLQEKEKSIKLKVDNLVLKQAAYNKSVEYQKEWERYHTLIDPNLTNILLDKKDLDSEIRNLNKALDSVKLAISEAQAYNNKVTAHNTKIDVLRKQKTSMLVDLAKYDVSNKELQFRLTNLQILTKTFSTTGLLAYKIECLVKDLEKLVNDYLLQMSDGRFQLMFKINAADKLNVVINDNGKDIDISDLSNGELTRVNVSTLLAIRKLMLSLSNSRINLLILDETVEKLDADGKERLIEVLLQEEYLNTILISHGFTHPLLEKVHIVKENEISRIE